MKKVFVVVEVVPYESDNIRGIYLSNEEAEARTSKCCEMEDLSYDVYYEIREMVIGEDVESY